MKSIYISSTCSDLHDYRRSVADALRNCGYDVDAMEKYPARDDRPKAACEADAAKCDVYVGIFAWRYGHVPQDDNAEGRSITELEYLAASKRRRFVFLLANETPWPGTLRDSDEAPDYGKRIRDLRTRLINETWTGFFKSPDDLAKQVLISLMQDDSTKDVNQLSALDDIRSAEYLGPSFLPNIQQRLGQLGSVDFVAITLGPTPWWTTRLHLVAALVSDFSDIRQFVLLDGEGRFVVMASPSEFRRALTKAYPKLEIAYLRSRELGRGSIGASDLDAVVLQYPIALAEVFGGQEEATVKQVVTPTIVRELGIKQQGEVLEERTEHSQFNLNSAILQRQMPYVILTQRGKLKGVIDRVELVSRIARTVSD